MMWINQVTKRFRQMLVSSMMHPVRAGRPSWMLRITIVIIKHAYAGQLNSFTHLRALLVLHDRDNLALVTNVTGHYSTNVVWK